MDEAPGSHIGSRQLNNEVGEREQIRFNIPLDTEKVTSGMIFPGNQLWWAGTDNDITSKSEKAVMTIQSKTE